MIKTAKITILIATVTLTTALALFLLFGPYSWQVTGYNYLGLTDHGYGKVPIAKQFTSYNDCSITANLCFPNNYTKWLFDEKLKVSKKALSLILGNNESILSPSNQTVTIDKLAKGETISFSYQPMYKEYIVYQQRKWRHEEKIDCHVFSPQFGTISMDSSVAQSNTT